MFERFDDDARQALALARREAGRLRHDFISTEHMLLGLMARRAHVAAEILASLRVDVAAVRNDVEERVEKGDVQHSRGQLPFTGRAKRALEQTLDEARGHRHIHIDTGHLLLGLMRVDDSVGSRVLAGHGLTLEAVRKEFLRLRPADTAKFWSAGFRSMLRFPSPDPEGSHRPAPGATPLGPATPQARLPVLRALKRIADDLDLLEPARGMSLVAYRANPYTKKAVERLLGEIDGTAIDLNLRLLDATRRTDAADPIMAGFSALADAGIISRDLATRMASAVGFRDAHIRDLDAIDDAVVLGAIEEVFRDYREYLAALARYLRASGS